jgi:TRAP transporter TAXI family solute receptor
MNKRLVAIAIPLLVLLAGFFVILRFAKPATPKELEILAGPKETTYYEYARQYADYLGEKGITVSIVETAGSLENLRRLAAVERPAAGFALSGVDRELQPQEHPEELVSLGSLSYEPFWLFVRSEVEVSRVTDLAGQKVALGPAESDARSLAKLMITANGIEDQIIEPPASSKDPGAIAESLIGGDLDAAFFVGDPKSPVITKLLESAAVQPASFERVTTYARLQPELAEVVLPEGAFDLARNIPAADITLLAPADNLVVRKDLHPAVTDLLLDAARSIHRKPTLFASRGAFPNMDNVSLPLSPAAIHFYENGPSPLRRYLPYWLASLISRFALIVAQVGAVVWILLKSLPTIRRLRFSMEQMGLYRQMEKLEGRMIEGADPAQLLVELKEIERQSAKLQPPRPLLSQYLELRQNIHDQRERIESHGEWEAEEATDTTRDERYKGARSGARY